MDNTKSTFGMAMIAQDIGDACDLIWANAALPRVTGLVGKPEPASRLGSPSDHPISQENTRESAQPNKRADSNQ